MMAVAAFAALASNRAGLNIWLSLLVGAAVGAVGSMAVNRWLYYPFIRRGTKLFTLVIVTLSAGIILQNMVQAIFGPNFFRFTSPGEVSMDILSARFTPSQLETIGLSVVVMLCIHLVLTNTKLGKAMRATATNAALARACGISTDRVVDVTWLISGALCGIGGVILALNVGSFSSVTVGNFLVVVLAAAVLGGIGHPYGAMLGALTIGLSMEVSAAFIAPEYKQVVAFVILIVVLLVRPQGILSEIASQRRLVE